VGRGRRPTLDNGEKLKDVMLSEGMPVDDIIGALADQQAELTRVLAALTGADWDRPSRCPEWTVKDVVLHLAQTNEMASASAGGHFDETIRRLTAGLAPADSVDEGADLMVARDRGLTGQEVRDRWQASVDALIAALAACEPGQRVPWVAGQLSARTLATTRLAETWIHTGDVTQAFGAAPAPSDRLWPICRLAWRTLPYAFAQAGRSLTGPVAFELHGPDGDLWGFTPEEAPATTIRGEALELCLVAGRRADPAATGLTGEGPDVGAILELVRTFA
jgi:uncharacterized protein (TIGR03084 family)